MWLPNVDFGERETGKATLDKFITPWTARATLHVRKHWLHFKKRLCLKKKKKAQLLELSFENFRGGENNDIRFSSAFSSII